MSAYPETSTLPSGARNDAGQIVAIASPRRTTGFCEEERELAMRERRGLR
jgi:hypothetical protein